MGFLIWEEARTRSRLFFMVLFDEEVWNLKLQLYVIYIFFYSNSESPLRRGREAREEGFDKVESLGRERGGGTGGGERDPFFRKGPSPLPRFLFFLL